MSDWLGILARRKAELAVLLEQDGESLEQLDDEYMLAQVVYEAIAAFIEHDESRLVAGLMDPDFDYDTAAVEWVEAQK